MSNQCSSWSTNFFIKKTQNSLCILLGKSHLQSSHFIEYIIYVLFCCIPFSTSWGIASFFNKRLEQFLFIQPETASQGLLVLRETKREEWFSCSSFVQQLLRTCKNMCSTPLLGYGVHNSCNNEVIYSVIIECPSCILYTKINHVFVYVWQRGKA